MSLEADFVKEIETASQEFVDNQEEAKKIETGDTGVESKEEIKPDAGETENDDGGSEEKGDNGSDAVGENDEGSGEGSGSDGGSGANKEAPKPPVIGDYAVTQAIHAGFSEEEAKSFGSEKALARAVEMLQDARDAAVKPEDKKATKGPLDDLPDLDPEIYGEEAIKILNAMKETIKAQQEQLDGYKEVSQQALQQQENVAAREIEQWFDKSVESLGKDFEVALGKGGYGSLDRGSSQFAKRDAIANQMAIVMSGYQARGLQPPPRDKVFESVAQMVLADEYQVVRERKITEKLAKRGPMHLNRPNGNKGGSKESADPLADTARLINEKFFST